MIAEAGDADPCIRGSAGEKPDESPHLLGVMDEEVAGTDLAQRGPLGRRQLEEPGPHLPGAPEIPDQTGPECADLLRADEEPDIPGVGLAQEGAHPVRALFRTPRGAGRTANRNLTCEEWRSYIGADKPYRKTCEGLPGPERCE